MAILDILQHPNPLLKNTSATVDEFSEELHTFINDLEDTRQSGPAAMGIAAPQLGRMLRIIILDCSSARKPAPNHGRLVLVNPVITEWDGFEIGREGCPRCPTTPAR